MKYTFFGIGIGIGIGMLLMTILLNVVAHDKIESNPDITLSEYWDGK